MREELLAYLWKTQKFQRGNLKTTSGDNIVIVKPGQENTCAGPDFFNAHIQIDNTLWVGYVELHLRASDWFSHQHQNDKNYDNVILHVVWEDDIPVYDASQQLMPTLLLSTYTSKQLINKYTSWLELTNKWILCADDLHLLPDLLRKQFFERIYVERLMEKTTLFQSWLALTKNNWEAVFFVALAKGFGLKENGMLFAQMALSIPWKAILQNAHNKLALEALFMGQIGLLDQDYDHEFFLKQKKTYAYFKHKYHLTPIAEKVHFFRLRPNNFPTIRLAQLAYLMHEKPRILTLIQEAKTLEDWYKVLDTNTSLFWETHYHFNTPTKKRANRLTKSFKDLLLINTVFPFLFQYYNYAGDQRKANVLDEVRQLSAEKNSVVTSFKKLGCAVNDALESQACLQLKHAYCEPKRCLQCAFGHKLLNL